VCGGGGGRQSGPFVKPIIPTPIAPPLAKPIDERIVFAVDDDELLSDGTFPAPSNARVIII
jgi:hypothetical protein